MASQGVPAQPLIAGDDEGSLVRGLLEGGAGAQAEFCRRFGPPIHHFASAWLEGDGDLAEEVMVETLAKAIRHIGRFDSRRSSLSAWLHGIARYQVLRERRGRQGRGSPPPSVLVPLDSVSDLPAPGDLAAQVTDHLAARHWVSHLRATLSGIELEVLVLRCVGELSVREIARIVGRSERAAESVLRRAKQKAREGVHPDAA
jgi:RNA polymerase sigma-70 factor (ECF subfamily)